MAALRSALLALPVFAAVLAASVVFWGILLGPVMEPVWPRLPDGWDSALAVALVALAVLSGLAAYAVALARVLTDALGLPRARARRHVATVGLLPPALALGAAWLVVSSLRFGW
jgi:hypothetical protein